MVSEINFSSEVIDSQSFESHLLDDAINSAITVLAQESIKDIQSNKVVALDPNRISRAINYLLDKVEDIQAIEKLYYAHIRHKNEDVKSVLLDLKQRAKGAMSPWVISFAFDTVVQEKNIDLMNFICKEFADHLYFDEDTAIQAMSVFIHNKDESSALWILDQVDMEVLFDEYEVNNLIQSATESQMTELCEKISERKVF